MIQTVLVQIVLFVVAFIEYGEQAPTTIKGNEKVNSVEFKPKVENVIFHENTLKFETSQELSVSFKNEEDTPMEKQKENENCSNVIKTKLKVNTVNACKQSEQINDNVLKVEGNYNRAVQPNKRENISVIKRDVNETSGLKTETSHNGSTNGELFGGDNTLNGSTVSSDKLGNFIRKLSSKLAGMNGQITKSPKIYLQHHERSTTAGGLVFSAVVKNDSVKSCNATPATVRVPLKYIKVKPYRHNGGDCGNHYYHCKHTVRGNRTNKGRTNHSTTCTPPVQNGTTKQSFLEFFRKGWNKEIKDHTSNTTNSTTVVSLSSSSTPVMNHFPTDETVQFVVKTSVKDYASDLATFTTFLPSTYKTKAKKPPAKHTFPKELSVTSTTSSCGINEIKDIFVSHSTPYNEIKDVLPTY